MIEYLKLQFVMATRKLKEAGIHPLVAYLFGPAAFVLLSEVVFQMTVFANYFMMLACFSLLIKFSATNRNDFLRTTFGDKKKKILRVTENLLLSMPFLFMLIYKNSIPEAGILFLLSIALAVFSLHSAVAFTLPTPFSKRPFEFAAGFRKTIFIFPPAYLLTAVALAVDNLNLGIFSMLLLFLTTMSYYSKPEQAYYVWVHAESPGRFLKNKMVIATKNASFLTAPVVGSLLLFYPSEFELILLFFFLGILFLSTVILAKYAAYPEEMNLPEGILIALCLYFPPLLLAVMPFFYIKSLRKLKLLLNDSN
jgi:hypothetical protein